MNRARTHAVARAPARLRGRPRPAVAILLLLLAAAGGAGPAAGQEDAGEPPPPRFAEVWFGGPLDSLYSAEYARLDSLCEPAAPACFGERLDTTAVRLAPVWGTADAVEPAGWLWAQLGTVGRYPFARLLYRPDAGEEVVLVGDLGDWGYGTTLPVRDTTERRVRLVVPGVDVAVWVSREGGAPGFGVVEVHGLEGRLWRLGPVDAERPGGGPVAALPAGVYLVLEVADGVVRLRPEVPGDMPCGEVEPDPAGVEIFRVPVRRLIGEDGLPAVEVAYPKGC